MNSESHQIGVHLETDLSLGRQILLIAVGYIKKEVANQANLDI